jgi:hypothetical protein
VAPAALAPAWGSSTKAVPTLHYRWSRPGFPRSGRLGNPKDHLLESTFIDSVQGFSEPLGIRGEVATRRGRVDPLISMWRVQLDVLPLTFTAIFCCGCDGGHLSGFRQRLAGRLSLHCFAASASRGRIASTPGAVMAAERPECVPSTSLKQFTIRGRLGGEVASPILGS